MTRKYKSLTFIQSKQVQPFLDVSRCELTFPSEGLWWLQGLGDTHWVLGWRVLPPLQTGEHGEVGTVRKPVDF